MNTVKFLNENSGLLSVIVNLILVIVTVVYVVLTGQMSKTSKQTIEQSDRDYSNKLQQDTSVRNNLIYLLNSEIYLNSFIYVFSQYYLLNKSSVKVSEKIQYLLKGITSVDLVSKGHIVTHIKANYWNEIKTLCAQYLSSDLMEELTGYYAGVEHSKIFSISGMSNEDFITFSKGQLLSTFKCAELLKRDVPNLRVKYEYEIDNKVLTFDKATGRIMEIN